MARFTLKHIEAFVAVSDLGTFRRAADRLSTTQPNISSRIAQLEAQLGVTLMERDAGSVRLTAAGKALLTPAREILAAVDGFVAATGDETKFDGVLRLGVGELIAHTFLRPFLLRMRERFPSVDIELTIDLSRNLSDALFSRELDLVFQNGPFDRTAPFTVPLGQSAYAWVCAPSLAVPRGALSASHLAAHPILTHARGTVPYQQLEEHFRDLDQPVRLVPATNLTTCLQMALDGFGVACLPEPIVLAPLEEGRLKRLAYGWRPESLRYAARSIVEPAPTFLREAAMLAQELYPSSNDKS